MRLNVKLLCLLIVLVTFIPLVSAEDQYYQLDLLLVDQTMYLVNSSFVDEAAPENVFLDGFLVYTLMENESIIYTTYFTFPETKVSVNFITGRDYFLPLTKVKLPVVARTNLTIPLSPGISSIVLINPNRDKSWKLNIEKIIAQKYQRQEDNLGILKRAEYTTIHSLTLVLIIVNIIILIAAGVVSFSRKKGIYLIASAVILLLLPPLLLFYNGASTLQDSQFYKGEIYENMEKQEISKEEVSQSVDIYLHYLRDKEDTKDSIRDESKARLDYIRNLLGINYSLFIIIFFFIMVSIVLLVVQKKYFYLAWSLVLSSIFTLAMILILLLIKNYLASDILAILFPFDVFTNNGFIINIVTAGIEKIFIRTVLGSIIILLAGVSLLLAKKYIKDQ